ncbi:MAG: hypothetical protein JWO06_2342 [Bacteroidota bacterium]|nr:hypothetical protein [Bacteroidota bacterium]
MAVHLLGIRHHGPGSARNVREYLKELKPDIILVEGPPEGEALLQSVIHKDMKLPVALLAYIPDQPQKAVFYPFAEFSAEWQAVFYGTYNNIPVKFFDLPLAHSFAIELAKKEAAELVVAGNENEDETAADDTIIDAMQDGAEGEQVEAAVETPAELPIIIRDPFQYLADIAGISDGELWWEINFESRKDNAQIFEAVQEAVTALREGVEEKNDPREKLREAWMRKMIRQAEKDGYERIAVICGAWHVPALADMPKAKEDNELLKNLPKVKIEATWIPWTFNRLTYRSGYGAGVLSPGWYNHLWQYPDDDGTRWMSKVAHMLRTKNMDTSVAHVIESVRLANALAALRNSTRASLDEFNEATTTVMGFGDDILLKLIREELIVSDQLGAVPEDVPKVPLLTDLERQQKKLRMPADAGIKEYNLDLRQPNDLARSVLLHRLRTLGVEWGEERSVSGKGTFKEQWLLQWQPEYSIKIIEQGVWGNTIEEAASAFLINKASGQTGIKEVADLIARAIPAELPKAIEALITLLDQLAATGSDVLELMATLPGIANVSRYGSVRKTDLDMLSGIAKAIIARISIGLPIATIGVDEEAAHIILNHIMSVNNAVNLLQFQEQTEEWLHSLRQIQQSTQAHALIAGYACRSLFDQKALQHEEVATHFSYALSSASEPMLAAFWVEGFLKGSGTILLLDANLWSILDNWVKGLEEEIFVQLLPLLRRSFSAFTNAERRKIGEKAKSGTSAMTKVIPGEANFNYERAIKGVPVVMQLLGINTSENGK